MSYSVTETGANVTCDGPGGGTAADTLGRFFVWEKQLIHYFYYPGEPYPDPKIYSYFWGPEAACVFQHSRALQWPGCIQMTRAWRQDC